jgi:hypothetical protein
MLKNASYEKASKIVYQDLLTSLLGHGGRAWKQGDFLMRLESLIQILPGRRTTSKAEEELGTMSKVDHTDNILTEP